MRNLVLSVVKDRKWDDIRCYAHSLVKSGFEGDKVMIVDNVSGEAGLELLSLGFHVIGQKIDGPHHFQTNRYLPALAFLESNKDQYKYVFWTDVCDVVFQSDPFPVIERLIPGPKLYYDSNVLLTVKEGWKIKDQPINDVWMQRITQGEEEYQRMREEEVLCSGTIAGFAPAMRWLFERMVQESGRVNGMQGIDQGIFNYLVRTPGFKGVTKIADPHDAFVTTAGIFLAPSDKEKWTIQCPVFDHEAGTAYVRTGWQSQKEYAVLHQYNRSYGFCDPNGTFRHAVERRYWNL